MWRLRHALFPWLGDVRWMRGRNAALLLMPHAHQVAAATLAANEASAKEHFTAFS
jgi:hypothetical protein